MERTYCASVTSERKIRRTVFRDTPIDFEIDRIDFL